MRTSVVLLVLLAVASHTVASKCRTKNLLPQIRGLARLIFQALHKKENHLLLKMREKNHSYSSHLVY